MRSGKYVYFFGTLLTLWMPISAMATDNPLGSNKVVPGISDKELREGLVDNFTPYIGMLITNPAAREEYLRQYYAFHALEQRAKELTPAEYEWVKVETAVRRQQILRDAVIKHELEALGHDIEALAKERYEVKKGTYQTRRRIKLAQIFMARKEGQEEEVKKTMEGILKQLENDNLRRHQQEQDAEKAADKDNDKAETANKTEDSEAKAVAQETAATEKDVSKEEVDLFSELAKQYSEGVNAPLGGYDSRWLLLPPESEVSDPVIKAASALLRRGEISGVVDGEHGYHILRLIDYVPNRQQEFDEVKEQIMTAIRNELWADKDKELVFELQAPKDMPINDELVLKVLKEVYAGRDESLKKPVKPEAEPASATTQSEAASVEKPVVAEESSVPKAE